MLGKWFAMLALVTLAGSAQAAPRGSCDDMIARFDAYLKAHPNAVGDLRQTVDAQLMHQPTRDSIEKAKKAGHQHLVDLLAKAKDEQSAHEEDGCRATLAQVQWMVTR